MAYGLEEQVNEIESIAGDRRSDRRYNLHLELRWKLIRRKRVLETGVGRTVDLSSGGMLFETDRPLPVGLNIEASVAWPVMLHNIAPMQLVISGRIVRSVGNRAAVQMVLHEFRTAPGEQRHLMPLTPRTPMSLFSHVQRASQ